VPRFYTAQAVEKHICFNRKSTNTFLNTLVDFKALRSPAFWTFWSDAGSCFGRFIAFAFIVVQRRRTCLSFGNGFNVEKQRKSHAPGWGRSEEQLESVYRTPTLIRERNASSRQQPRSMIWRDVPLFVGPIGFFRKLWTRFRYFKTFSRWSLEFDTKLPFGTIKTPLVRHPNINS